MKDSAFVEASKASFSGFARDLSGANNPCTDIGKS